MPMVFTLQSEALEWAEETAEKNLDYAKSEKDRIEQAEQDALLVSFLPLPQNGQLNLKSARLKLTYVTSGRARADFRLDQT